MEDERGNGEINQGQTTKKNGNTRRADGNTGYAYAVGREVIRKNARESAGKETKTVSRRMLSRRQLDTVQYTTASGWLDGSTPAEPSPQSSPSVILQLAHRQQRYPAHPQGFSLPTKLRRLALVPGQHLSGTLADHA